MSLRSRRLTFRGLDSNQDRTDPKTAVLPLHHPGSRASATVNPAIDRQNGGVRASSADGDGPVDRRAAGAPPSGRQLVVVVLAAGAGTRMKSTTPKILHRISGRTLLGHVLAAARELDPARTLVVVRHERDRIVEAIEPDLPGLTIVDQDEIPGTGRALDIAIPALGMAFVGDVVVLSADAPLVTAAELRAMLRTHRETGAATTVLGTRLADPRGYGRIVLGADGTIERIVEHADASAEERAIDLVNAGV